MCRRTTYADAGGQLPDLVELLVSEVVTNAVVHGAGDTYRVAVTADLAIEVWDASRCGPNTAVPTKTPSVAAASVCSPPPHPGTPSA
ncbi:hypothetical protein [Streptomyces albipurpureus]|uniref:Histidine kinase/HSP90-like ATPase domain-containing protein n=1 Tax=Streptomyces albipurpureus TaxID=2897419 RepID=A0ABT0UIJ1_9ACTN|nr:hypothetical protein [Streptomyces sp. CWNU-1]MCM2387819.1 hypothetical protein [Streptomyces sp. CWNU-1]